jgi:hypothetical protein
LARRVTITMDGREGRIRYSDSGRVIEGYYEFGGADVLGIVSMGAPDEWARAHPWAVADRAEILRFVADELVRQQAPSWTADIDDARGVILFRQRPGAAAPVVGDTKRARAATFLFRLRDLRSALAVVVVAVALLGGGIMWGAARTLTVAQASGVPLNESVRYGDDDASGGIATLIQKTDPHPPRWSGRGGNDTVSIAILVVPLDGSSPRVVPVARGLSPTSVSLARIIGSDGRTLWFDAAGLHGVRLRDYNLVTPRDLRAANPSLDPTWWDDPRGVDIVGGKLQAMRIDRSGAVLVDPASWRAAPAPPVVSNARFMRRSPADHYAAGYLAAPDVWIGLHAASEIEGAYRPGRWIRPEESADDAAQPRRLYRAELEPSSDGARHRIRAIAPVGEAAFLNAAFLRLHEKDEPLRRADPDSALMVHTSAPGLRGTLVVSRVTPQGEMVWSVDTGLDRFKLQQILPGSETFAFVGTRLPIPDRLSEPLVVLVDADTGEMKSHSLWR